MMPQNLTSSAWLLLLGLLLPAHVVQAQPSKPAPGAGPASQPAAVAADPLSIEEEELLVIKPTPYNPSLKRDPFKAPTDVENDSKGDLIEDIGVKGRIVSNGKVLAVVSDSRGNTRWLGVGYKFRDGELAEITDKAVVFRQRDVSSTGVYRMVVKPFKREGGK